MSLVKQRISERFDKAAQSYDQYAVIQYQIAKELHKLCAPWHELVLDIGAGSGFMANLLQAQYPKIILLDLSYQLLSRAAESHPYKIQADFESLPFADASMPAIVSNMALQWSDDFIKSLRESRRVLKAGGEFYFSMPIAGTFSELHKACQQVDANLKQFMSLDEVTHSLTQQGFGIEVVQQDYWQACFPNLRHLLKSIKATGVSYAPGKASKTLRGKYFLREVDYYYQASRTSYGLLPLTYQIGFIKAVKQ